jgi:hypothetical protein
MGQEEIDELDEHLQQLGQLMGDLTLVVGMMRGRIAAVDRLRAPLVAELMALQIMISQTIPLLEGR